MGELDGCSPPITSQRRLIHDATTPCYPPVSVLICSGQPEAAAPEVPAAPPAAEAALPPGWVAAQDPGSGRTYYANTVTGVTQWDIPTEAVQTTKQPVWGLSGASTAAPDGRKKLSPMSKGPWKRLVDYSRMEATSQISAKATKFAGLRKFAEVAAAKKQEAVSRKAGEAADKAAADAAAAVAKAQPRKPILTMLDVDVPPLQRQNVSAQGWAAGAWPGMDGYAT